MLVSIPIIHLFTTEDYSRKLFKKTVQQHIVGSNLRRKSQFCFYTRHGATLQCMRFTDR
jgi:hypothetical protein